MTGETATVFIVDDEASVRHAVARLMRSAGFKAVAFDSPGAFLNAQNSEMPGCLVLDVAMPGLNGLELQRELTARGAALPIIFLTGHADVPMSVRAMKSGAVDFLTKPVNDAELIEAVRVAIKEDQIQRQLRAEVAEIQRRIATLTPREREVMKHVISGRLNKQTAALLGTVEKTIKVHRARVMEKLRVESVAELVRLAEKAGLGTTEELLYALPMLPPAGRRIGA